jgi:hypothetical protein
MVALLGAAQLDFYYGISAGAATSPSFEQAYTRSLFLGVT